MVMKIIKVLGNATCWISRRRCLTLFFMTGVLFFIIDKRILSQKKHWWNNKNISFILNNLNLSFSSYDKPRSVYTLYHVLKTRISDVCSFPPNGLYGHIPLNRSVLNNTILNMIHSYMDDGHYRPQHCTAVQKVAIVIPYRNRQKQLKVFLNNILPRIKRQQLEFVIYVIEQKSGMPFNRGMISNVGFKEAMSDMEFDCIVFHDVDVLPEDDRNFYICSDNPIHMSVKVEQFGYRLPYEKIAGGIVTFSRQQFEEINGFSNQFFGWGGEDDDLYRRIKFNKYELIRPFEDFGMCGSVSHKPAERSIDRKKFLKYSYEVWKNDGLNNLEYRLLRKENKQLYRWIYVSI